MAQNIERRRNVAATLAALEFATIRLRLVKVAGRVIESATRICIALASCCPEAETFSLIALKLQPSGP